MNNLQLSGAEEQSGQYFTCKSQWPALDGHKAKFGRVGHVHYNIFLPYKNEKPTIIRNWGTVRTLV